MYSLTAPVSVRIGRLNGDKSGFIHVGYHQSFSVEVADPYIPFGLRVYENGSIAMPKRVFLQKVNFRSSGKVCFRWFLIYIKIFSSKVMIIPHIVILITTDIIS